MSLCGNTLTRAVPEEVRASEAGVMDGCSVVRYRCWEANSSSLQGQFVLLNVESSQSLSNSSLKVFCYS